MGSSRHGPKRTATPPVPCERASSPPGVPCRSARAGGSPRRPRRHRRSSDWSCEHGRAASRRRAVLRWRDAPSGSPSPAPFEDRDVDLRAVRGGRYEPGPRCFASKAPSSRRTRRGHALGADARRPSYWRTPPAVGIPVSSAAATRESRCDALVVATAGFSTGAEHELTVGDRDGHRVAVADLA